MSWIPVTERVPTHPYSVLGWITKGGLVLPDERGMRDLVTYFPDKGVWLQFTGDDEDAIVEVSHWQDMPPPPGGWQPGASSDDECAPELAQGGL